MTSNFSLKNVLLCLCIALVLINSLFVFLLFFSEEKEKEETKTQFEIDREKVEYLKRTVNFNDTYYINGDNIYFYYGSHNN